MTFSTTTTTTTTTTLLCLLLASHQLLLTSASPFRHRHLSKRQLIPSITSSSSGGGYTPQYTTCPSTPLIRTGVNDTVGDAEKAWVDGRTEVVKGGLRAFLEGAGVEGLNVDGVVNAGKVPKVAVAVSGGGLRAMLYGGSILSTFDSRTNTTNTTTTNTISPASGLLQLTTYLTGLSGGSWLLASLYTTDFPTISTARNTVWNTDRNLILPFGGSEDRGGLGQFVESVGEYKEFVDDVVGKKDAGFNVSVTDLWSRLVSVHITNASNYGESQTWSSLANYSAFQNHQAPFPIVTFVQRTSGEARVTIDAHVWESNFFETGSNNPAINSFILTPYYGTYLSNSTPT
ncbi:Lysophospholipase 1, partial [Borealophlyctis nickersoniae]